MRRPLRWFLNGPVLLSLLVCLAAAALWAHGHFVWDRFSKIDRAGRGYEISSVRGVMRITTRTYWPQNAGPWEYEAWEAYNGDPTPFWMFRGLVRFRANDQWVNTVSDQAAGRPDSRDHFREYRFPHWVLVYSGHRRRSDLGRWRNRMIYYN